MQGFSDDSQYSYNKESSIYHFYRGMNLANQLGSTLADGLSYTAELTHPSDPIANVATNLGVHAIGIIRNQAK